jgi:retron-type reverse transcriptase
MKINLFGFEFSLTKTKNNLAKQGQKALKDKSLEAIHKALDDIENRGLKYSEYRVQKLSNLSINTVKKYREEIALYRANNNRDLFE